MVIPAAADLDGEGDLDRFPDRAEYLAGHFFVAHESRAGPGFRNLWHGASHIEVDDIGAPVRQDSGSLGEGFCLTPKDLHRDRLLFWEVAGHVESALVSVYQGLGADFL